ncbi:MAG: hypothetical protein ABIH87_03100 [bacterium]
MKKTAIFLSFIFALALLASGCGTQTANNDDQSATVSGQNGANRVNEVIKAKVEVIGGETTGKEEIKVDIDVSKQDLDELKTDIEEMDFEDLNALSD